LGALIHLLLRDTYMHSVYLLLEDGWMLQASIVSKR